LSFGFEGFSRYFGKALDGVIADCLAREGRTSPFDVCFLRHALLGLCLDYMRDEKGRSDPDARLEALQEAVRRFEQA
ncbi:MAG: hypothetical protein IJW22_00270, partial [Clostridia bacterium]|nr:hypothetical protein [Clostridia bacterium]